MFIGIPLYKKSLYSCNTCIDTRLIFSVFRTTEVYNHIYEQWTLSAPLNRRRHDFGVTTYTGKIYVAGGIDGTGLGPMRSVEVFSGETIQWTTQENKLTLARAFLGLGNLTRNMYAIGGNSTIPNIEYFDTDQNTWKSIRNSEPDCGHLYHRATTAIAWDKKFLFFIGGTYRDKNPKGISERRGRFVYIYDTFAEAWFRIPDMSECRSGARALVMYDREAPPKPGQASASSRDEMRSQNTPPRSHQYERAAQRGTAGGTPPRRLERDLKLGSENRDLLNAQEKISSPPRSMNKSDTLLKDSSPSKRESSPRKYVEKLLRGVRSKITSPRKSSTGAQPKICTPAKSRPASGSIDDKVVSPLTMDSSGPVLQSTLHHQSADQASGVQGASQSVRICTSYVYFLTVRLNSNG